MQFYCLGLCSVIWTVLWSLLDYLELFTTWHWCQAIPRKLETDKYDCKKYQISNKYKLIEWYRYQGSEIANKLFDWYSF